MSCCGSGCESFCGSGCESCCGSGCDSCSVRLSAVGSIADWNEALSSC